jgi:cell division protein FtsB
MSLETWTGERTVRATGIDHGWCRKVAISFYAALALYCVLSAFFGQDGLIAYRKLEEREAAMAANLSLLAAQRESLNAELESLKSDPDRAALEARSLGYLRKGETEVILMDRVEQVKRFEAGTVLPFAESGGMSDIALKEIAFGAFLAVLAFLCAPRKRE